MAFYKRSCSKPFSTEPCNALRTRGEQFSICHCPFQRGKEDKSREGERNLGKFIVKLLLAQALFQHCKGVSCSCIPKKYMQDQAEKPKLCPGIKLRAVKQPLSCTLQPLLTSNVSNQHQQDWLPWQGTQCHRNPARWEGQGHLQCLPTADIPQETLNMTPGSARLKTESEQCQPLSPIFSNTRHSCNKFSKHSDVPILLTLPCWHRSCLCPVPRRAEQALPCACPCPCHGPAGCVTVARGHSDPGHCQQQTHLAATNPRQGPRAAVTPLVAPGSVAQNASPALLTQGQDTSHTAEVKLLQLISQNHQCFSSRMEPENPTRMGCNNW